MLLDLGVSSHQIDAADRGFSFRFDGPLDMRMDQTGGRVGEGAGGLTADEIVNMWPQEQIAELIWKYGEERHSRQVARAIVAARPLTSTTQLAEIVGKAGPPGPPKDATKRVARVFQALRIEVNREMAELEAVLSVAASLVRPGGRLAVLSYHSLEDRRVKRLLRSGSFRDETPATDPYGNLQTPWKVLTRQPVLASDSEISINKRARSARLRVGQRTEHMPAAPPPPPPLSQTKGLPRRPPRSRRPA